MSNPAQPVLYFDGVCNLCNGAVQFVIRHDRKKQFMFASLQSASGSEAQEAIKKVYGMVPDSIILFYNNTYYTKSTAIIRTGMLLGGLYTLMGILLAVPKLIRDAVYNGVAKKRYKWFGKKDECMIPTPELKSRFLP